MPQPGWTEVSTTTDGLKNKPTKKERYINPVSTAVTFFSFGFWFLKKYESTKKC